MGAEEDVFLAAKRIIGDPAIMEVFKRIERQQIDRWRYSKGEDATERDDAYHMIRAIEGLRNLLDALAAEPDVRHFNRRLKIGK